MKRLSIPFIMCKNQGALARSSGRIKVSKRAFRFSSPSWLGRFVYQQFLT